MKTKIQDVAKEANVSVATVSRVVNDVPLVNEDTKQKVLEAIKKTGYKRNMIARSLKIQKTNTLGIMIPDISNPLYTEIVRGAEDASAIYKYNMILSNTDFTEGKEEESLDVLVEKQCDGIIYIAKDLDENMKEQLKNAPCEVVLGCVEDQDGEISSVVANNLDAAYDLGKALLERGHKNIAILCDTEKGQIEKDRLKGIKKAMDEAGIELDEELIKEGKADMNGGFAMATEIVESGKECDLMICTNDQIAIGAINALNQKNISIPDDIAVAGFSDLWITPWLSPSLTTVNQNLYDLGAIAARMLIKKIENQPTDQVQKVDYNLVFRDSTKSE